MDLLSTILLLGGLALIIGGIVAAVTNRMRPVGRDKGVVGSGFPSAVLVGGGVAALAIGIALSAFIQIPAGYVGVVRQFGAVTGVTLDPGLHFVTPIVNCGKSP